MSTDYITAATVGEIAPGKMKRVVANGEAILLANVEGEHYAVSDICTHEDASLYLGCLKGKRVQCSLHSGMFDVTTGEAVEEPAEIALKTYPVRINGDKVEVGVSDKGEQPA
ncbi:MAG TPA: non-heme iron oxygenase ferredoxin subunit [Gammaproteobacteria bacterium]|nr:non-heme iron oxygenase ferredoxin subunit [Gammaproteobacteria bacterium]